MDSTAGLPDATPMRVPGPALLLAAMLLLGGACSNGAGGIEVEVATAPPATETPSPTPGPSPTPVPPPELLLSAIEVYQGGTVLASVTGDITGGTITFLDEEYPLVQGDASMFAFIGVGTDAPPGDHELTVSFDLASGSSGTLSQTVAVLTNEWTVDHLDFDPDKETLLDPAVAQAELELLEQVYSRHTAAKLWESPWIVPVPGPLTARFGEQRSINGGPVGGHHGGTDLSGEPGTPVQATSGGVVVLARQLQVRGNMVIIDHGSGVLSGYAHLDSFGVTEGQQVAAGDIIGAVGNTGLSTGAHLHWEMAVHGVLVDALRFVDGSNGF